MIRPPYRALCIGGPTDGDYIKSDNARRSLPTGDYVFCRTAKPDKWVWHPKADEEVADNQQISEDSDGRSD